MSEKASKGRFFKPEKLQNHSNEIKGKEKKKERGRERGEGKEEKRKKTVVAHLVFIVGTLEIIFGRKKLFDPKGPFSNNVFKNPTR